MAGQLLLVTSAIWYTSWPELPHAKFGAQKQGSHLSRKNGTGKYSIIPATLRKEKIKDRVHKSPSPGPGGTLWRSARLSACVASRQRGNTVFSADTRGKCSTRLQLLAGKEQQALSLGLEACALSRGHNSIKEMGHFMAEPFPPSPCTDAWDHEESHLLYMASRRTFEWTSQAPAESKTQRRSHSLQLLKQKLWYKPKVKFSRTAWRHICNYPYFCLAKFSYFIVYSWTEGL